MIKLLQILFFGHEHKWHVHKEVMVRSDYGDSYTRVYLRCEICGNMKTFNGGS